jgi:hypothetical protein
MKMKKFELDLSGYKVVSMEPVTEVVDGKEVRQLKEVENVYPLRSNLSIWLRSIGIFRSGEDIAEAVNVAKSIRDCTEDSIQLDGREADIVKQAINRLVELTADGKANLGGEVHEEAIVRVIKMKEVE